MAKYEGSGNIKTNIQSGNVLFENVNTSIQSLSSKVTEAIECHFGFDVPFIVKSKTDLQRIFNHCPFSEEKKESSMFVILNRVPVENNEQLALNENKNE